MGHSEGHNRERPVNEQSIPQAEMNMEVSFSPRFTIYMKGGSRLVLYKTERTVVKSVDYRLTAVRHPMICRHDRITFRSERISEIVSPSCTYSNDVKLESSE
jgi:hypothetical protein